MASAATGTTTTPHSPIQTHQWEAFQQHVMKFIAEEEALRRRMLRSQTARTLVAGADTVDRLVCGKHPWLRYAIGGLGGAWLGMYVRRNAFPT
jgi:hypothetical protein